MKKQLVAGAAALALAVGGGVATATVPGLIDSAAAKNYSRSAYGSNPHAGKNPNAQNGWGPAAWPNCPSASQMATAQSKSGDKAVVRRELAPLVSELMTRTEAMGYNIRMSGGFNCRPIRGSKTIPSNHSKGKAVDINWDKNPMGSKFVSDIPPAVVKMWEEAGFYWGGRYSGRPDAMHFEYVLPPSAVQGKLNALRGKNGPKPTTKPTSKPTTPASCDFAKTDQKVWQKNSRNDAASVKEVQCRLNARGHKLVVDGKFGPKTDAAVRSFQRSHGLAADGIVGPKTWAKLNG
ncbi:hypothetical protein GCM10027418_22150 [Mariniluteicoccus endophyticus]